MGRGTFHILNSDDTEVVPPWKESHQSRRRCNLTRDIFTPDLRAAERSLTQNYRGVSVSVCAVLPGKNGVGSPRTHAEWPAR
jgi:hypothetical protein